MDGIGFGVKSLVVPGFIRMKKTVRVPRFQHHGPSGFVAMQKPGDPHKKKPILTTKTPSRQEKHFHFKNLCLSWCLSALVVKFRSFCPKAEDVPHIIESVIFGGKKQGGFQGP